MIRNTRQPRFNVSFAFMTEHQEISGGTHPRLMAYQDIEFMLRLMSPIKSEEWLAQISRVPRHSVTYITVIEALENGMKMAKAYKFERT